MGCLRLFLALTVFVGHLSLCFPAMQTVPGTTVGGQQAVQLFFVVSGFYMALVLRTRYVGPGSYGLFLSNRALRLYPSYLVVALVSVTLALTLGDQTTLPSPIRLLGALDWPSKVAVTLANLGIVGQDWLMFAAVGAGGSLVPTTNYGLSSPPVWQMLWVPPAWSLSVELMFYVLAPFLVRRSIPLIVGVILASSALRVWLGVHYGLRGDPWSYRFFPTELALFLMGVLGYRVAERFDPKRLPTFIAWAIVAAFVIAILGYRAIDGLSNVRRTALFTLAAIAVPVLFEKTKNSRLDRYIGELSYPVYIVHYLVLTYVPPRMAGAPASLIIATSLALTLAASAALIHLVAGPVERLRRRRVEHVRASMTETIAPKATTTPPPL